VLPAPQAPVRRRLGGDGSLHQQSARTRREQTRLARWAENWVVARTGSTAKIGIMPRWASGRPCGWWVIATGWVGWMDALQPDSTINHDVNGGVRAGIRRPALSRTRVQHYPRLVYQRVKMDGWNRIDAFNILANPLRLQQRIGSRASCSRKSTTLHRHFLLAM